MIPIDESLVPNFMYIWNSSYYKTIIKTMYSYKRSYHTLDHIKFMLYKLLSLKLEINGLDELCTAILFHDIIMYTDDDIENTKKFVHDLLTNDRNITLNITDVIKLIDGTNHEKDITLNDRQKLIHDLDLAILSSGRKNYKKYSKQVASEIIDNITIQYIPKRIEFLQNILKKGIYQTKFFDEEKAIRNLKNELYSISPVEYKDIDYSIITKEDFHELVDLIIEACEKHNEQIKIVNHALTDYMWNVPKNLCIYKNNDKGMKYGYIKIVTDYEEVSNVISFNKNGEVTFGIDNLIFINTYEDWKAKLLEKYK